MSIVTGTLAAAVFPAVSVATTLKVCDPLATPALFQETLYAGPAPVTTAPRFAPSKLELHTRHAGAIGGGCRYCDYAAVDIRTVRRRPSSIQWEVRYPS